MPKVNKKTISQIKKELKSEITPDIYAVLSMIRAVEQALIQELERRKVDVPA